MNVKKQIWVKNEKQLKKAVKEAKRNEVVVFDEAKPTEAELKKWANQKVTITCTMHEAGDLMDLLFMADPFPLDNAFRDTIKLNKMEKAYSMWLNRMVEVVCPEIGKERRKCKECSKLIRR